MYLATMLKLRAASPLDGDFFAGDSRITPFGRPLCSRASFGLPFACLAMADCSTPAARRNLMQESKLALERLKYWNWCRLKRNL